jgi:hypothetical protein
MSALYELQVAVVTRLKADAAVIALVGDKVYDTSTKHAVDDDENPVSPPWLIVDTPTGVEQGSTSTADGFGHTITVRAVASDRTGNEEVTTLGKAAKTALRPPLTISGFKATRLRLDFETVLPEIDRRSMPMRFRVSVLEM